MPGTSKSQEQKEPEKKIVYSDPKHGKSTECFHYIRHCGSGTNGVVWAATYKSKKTGSIIDVAVKLFKEDVMNIDYSFKREVETLRALRRVNNPNVIKIITSGREKELGRRFIALELAKGGTLSDAIKAKKITINDDIYAANAIWETLNGLAFLHSIDINHGDMKPGNVLIKIKQHKNRLIAELAIADFSHSRKSPVGTVHEARRGTRGYDAPEIFTEKYVDKKTDVYSVGVILCVLLFGKNPFKKDGDFPSSYNEIKEWTLKGIEKLDVDWRSITKPAKAMLLRLLKCNPLWRPSARAAMNDEWLINTGFRGDEKNEYMRLNGRKHWISTESPSATVQAVHAVMKFL